MDHFSLKLRSFPRLLPELQNKLGPNFWLLLHPTGQQAALTVDFGQESDKGNLLLFIHAELEIKVSGNNWPMALLYPTHKGATS